MKSFLTHIETPGIGTLYYWRCTFADRTYAEEAGFTWNDERKEWWTAHLSVATKLVAYAKPETRAYIEAACAELRKKAEMQERIRRMSGAHDVDDPDAWVEAHPLPEGLAFRPYQRAGVAWLERFPHALLADDMGLGKTIQALGALNTLPEDLYILIVCPAGLKINWHREAEKWLMPSRPIQRIDTVRDAIEWNRPGITIINYDIVHRQEIREKLIRNPWDVMILDEAHRCKNISAKRTQTLLGGYYHKARTRFVGVATGTKYIWALSGTPIENYPREIWSLASTLWPKEFGSNYPKFAYQYCAAYQTEFGLKDDGASNEEELATRLRTVGMIRRLTRDVEKDIPPMQRQLIVLPDDKMKRVLKAEEPYRDAVNKWLDGEQRFAFEDMSVVRRQTAVAKAPLVIQHVEDLLQDSDEKVIVFGYHRELLEILHEALGEKHGAVLHMGGVSEKRRQAAVDGFQNDPKVRVFIGNQISAGEGLTLTVARLVVMAELNFVPGKVEQPEKRAHRIGQTRGVLVQHLVVAGSIEERITHSYLAKQDIQDLILNQRTEEA